MWQFRRKGYQTRVLPGPPGTPGFEAAYAAARAGKPAPPRPIGEKPSRSVAALIADYIASPDFRDRSEQTQRHRMVFLERIRTKHGHRYTDQIQTRHAAAILNDPDIATTAQQRSRLLIVLRKIMKLAMMQEIIKTDPTALLSAPEPKSRGWESWTDAHIATYLAHHPPGSTARLAMLLALCTGQRRSDVVRMGWQHVRDGSIVIRQQKTGTLVEVPIQPELWAELSDLPRDRLTFLMTEFDRPFKVAGFGNWFRKRCIEAGLRTVRMHGLRKAKGRLLAEAGATASEITAILGHETIQESEPYVRAANRRTLAASGQAKLTAPTQIGRRRDK